MPLMSAARLRLHQGLSGDRAGNALRRQCDGRHGSERLAEAEIDGLRILADGEVDAEVDRRLLGGAVAKADPGRGEEGRAAERGQIRSDAAEPAERRNPEPAEQMLAKLDLRRPGGAVAEPAGLVAAQIAPRAVQADVVEGAALRRAAQRGVRGDHTVLAQGTVNVRRDRQLVIVEVAAEPGPAEHPGRADQLAAARREQIVAPVPCEGGAHRDEPRMEFALGDLALGEARLGAVDAGVEIEEDRPHAGVEIGGDPVLTLRDGEIALLLELDRLSALAGIRPDAVEIDVDLGMAAEQDDADLVAAERHAVQGGDRLAT